MCVAAIVFAGWWFWLRPWQPQPGMPVFRVSVQASPPAVQIEKGGPKGVVIDIFAEACRRRGIRIEWLLMPVGPDQSLGSGKADLWPQVGELPARHKYLYISKPWDASTMRAVVRTGSGLTADNINNVKTVTYQPIPLLEALAAKHFPRAGPIRVVASEDILRAVRRNEAEPGIVSSGKLVVQSLQSVKECGDELDFVALPMDRMIWGVGASFQRPDARHAADVIRDEITKMAKDGSLSTISIRKSRDPLNDISLITRLNETERRFWWMAVGLAVMGACCS